MPTSRRTFLVAGAAGVAAAAAAFRSAAEPAEGSTLEVAPGSSGIEHVVVLTMENRSFDHLLGWLPQTGSRADGRQAGLRYPDRQGHLHPTHHLTSFSSCGYADPQHGFLGGRIDLDHGRCDGWLLAPGNDSLVIGYYEQADLPFLGRAATDWTTCDRYFAATMSDTYPNRFYLHCAQTDRLHNSLHLSHLPTIWDRLAAAGVSARYYYSDAPFAVLLGDHAPADVAAVGDSAAPTAGTFFADAAGGLLPAVSYVEPRFLSESAGTSGDDHPHADIRAGELFMNQVYDAVRTSPSWSSTVLVITFDEGGGFFDHVPPRRAPDTWPKAGLRGFRVPTVVISPFARRGAVSHATYDHTSILKLIEWRWGLAPLTPRDAAARNLADALDLRRPADTSSPSYAVAAPPVTPCPGSARGPSKSETDAIGLRELAVARGWPGP